MGCKEYKPGSAETQAEAQSHRAPAAPAPSCDASNGAPPSNTAPANCIDGEHRILRAGVDSLYLSFKGELFEHIELALIEFKSMAQSEDLLKVASAVLNIDDHRFEVLGRGSRNYPYIIKDGAFNIQLSKASSETMPLAYVQISSKYLTESGFIGAVQELKRILHQLGSFNEIKVSRVDIYCDFVTNVGFGELPQIGWISRSNKRNCYFENDKFSGFVFGQGSRISARLYDKTLQITKSKQDYLKDLWWSEGWDRKSQVWRLEFQIMRPVLVEVGISSFTDLVGSLEVLWHYATTNWLRLVLPGKDQTKSRWPSHPLWEVLQGVTFEGCCEGLIKRKPIRRVPSENYFFINGLAAITSFMAAREIESFETAMPLFLDEARNYHEWRSLETGEDIEEYCKIRAALKARDYNTRINLEKINQVDNDNET